MPATCKVRRHYALPSIPRLAPGDSSFFGRFSERTFSRRPGRRAREVAAAVRARRDLVSKFYIIYKPSVTWVHLEIHSRPMVFSVSSRLSLSIFILSKERTLFSDHEWPVVNDYSSRSESNRLWSSRAHLDNFVLDGRAGEDNFRVLRISSAATRGNARGGRRSGEASRRYARVRALRLLRPGAPDGVAVGCPKR